MRPILLLAVAPTFLLAQREGVPISGGDIERLNPARVLIDQRDQLKLEKEQLTALEVLRKAFDTDAKLMADSVKRYQRAITTPPPLLKRPPEGKPETRKDSISRAKLDSNNRIRNDEYFETVTAGRRDLAAALLTLKDRFDADLAKVSAVLNDSQRTTAALSLERAATEFTRRLRLANVR
jgi:hypothetical protein